MAGELYDGEGNRKYLTAEERKLFLKAADRAAREVRTFCHVLHFTGYRISEALAPTADRIDYASGTITFESLKKRRGGIYRSIPVPPSLPEALDLGAHDGLAESQGRHGCRQSGGRATGQPQGPAARLRLGCCHHRHFAEHGAETART